MTSPLTTPQLRQSITELRDRLDSQEPLQFKKKAPKYVSIHKDDCALIADLMIGDLQTQWLGFEFEKIAAAEEDDIAFQCFDTYRADLARVGRLVASWVQPESYDLWFDYCARIHKLEEELKEFNRKLGGQG
jgi:hypothetical protein